MISILFTCVIYLLRYHNFNLGDIVQFSENVSNGGRRSRTHVFFKKYIKESSNCPTRNIIACINEDKYRNDIIFKKNPEISSNHVT